MERFTCDPTHRSSLVFDCLCCETSSKRWLLNWVQTRPFPEPQWTEGKILLGPEISQFTKKPCEQELNILIPCKNQPFQKVFQQNTSYRIRTTTIQVKYWAASRCSLDSWTESSQTLWRSAGGSPEPVGALRSRRLDAAQHSGILSRSSSQSLYFLFTSHKASWELHQPPGGSKTTISYSCWIIKTWQTVLNVVEAAGGWADNQ